MRTVDLWHGDVVACEDGNTLSNPYFADCEDEAPPLREHGIAAPSSSRCCNAPTKEDGIADESLSVNIRYYADCLSRLSFE
jgi:hypothetical protein